LLCGELGSDSEWRELVVSGTKPYVELLRGCGAELPRPSQPLWAAFPRAPVDVAWPALNLALYAGHPGVVKQLLARQDVARLLSSGDLCSAVKAGRPQIVRLLVAARAVIDRRVIDEVAHTGTGEMFDEVVDLIIDPVASSSLAGSHSLVRIRNALWRLTLRGLPGFFWDAGACLLVRRTSYVVCCVSRVVCRVPRATCVSCAQRRACSLRRECLAGAASGGIA
jgi:hypothetical protein